MCGFAPSVQPLVKPENRLLTRAASVSGLRVCRHLQRRERKGAWSDSSSRFQNRLRRTTSKRATPPHNIQAADGSGVGTVSIHI